MYFTDRMIFRLTSIIRIVSPGSDADVSGIMTGISVVSNFVIVSVFMTSIVSGMQYPARITSGAILANFAGSDAMRFTGSHDANETMIKIV
jgi:hypothetical protein